MEWPRHPAAAAVAEGGSDVSHRAVLGLVFMVLGVLVFVLGGPVVGGAAAMIVGAVLVVAGVVLIISSGDYDNL